MKNMELEPLVEEEIEVVVGGNDTPEGPIEPSLPWGPIWHWPPWQDGGGF